MSLRPPQPEASATNVILLRRDGRRTSHYYPGPAVDWKRSLEATAPSSESASIWFFASGFGCVEEEDLRQLLAVFAEFRRRIRESVGMRHREYQVDQVDVFPDSSKVLLAMVVEKLRQHVGNILRSD